MDTAIQLTIVGSIGIDTIETPQEKRADILGGSVSYACAAASFFTQSGMVGVVGTDFPQHFRDIWTRMNIDLSGLQTSKARPSAGLVCMKRTWIIAAPCQRS